MPYAGQATEVMPAEEQELIRKWTVYLVVCGFLTGLGLCLVIDHNASHHGSEVPLTVIHTAQACATSAVLGEDQSDSHRLLLASSFDTERNPFYEGVLLAPPFPPPRG